MVKGRCPAARDGHAMCVMNGNIYVFGGYEEESDSFTNDMFVYNVRRNTWSEVHYQNYAPPTGRDFHTMTCIGNYLYIFGGRSYESNSFHPDDETYDDTIHVFDTITGFWSEHILNWPNNAMGRRSHSAFAYKSRLYIFGGFNPQIEQHFNDLWMFDPINRSLHEIKPGGEPPVPRRRQCCCLHNDRLYIFGGTSPATATRREMILRKETLYDHNDLHVLDFCPSLKTLCLVFAQRKGLCLSGLPDLVGWEMRIPRSHNTITKPTSQHG